VTLGSVRVIGAGVVVMMCVEEVRQVMPSTIVLHLLLAKIFYGNIMQPLFFGYSYETNAMKIALKVFIVNKNIPLLYFL